DGGPDDSEIHCPRTYLPPLYQGAASARSGVHYIAAVEFADAIAMHLAEPGVPLRRVDHPLLGRSAVERAFHLGGDADRKHASRYLGARSDYGTGRHERRGADLGTIEHEGAVRDQC